MTRFAFLALLGIGVWLTMTNAPAQNAPALPERNERSETASRETFIRQTPLDVIYLSDPDGNPFFKLPGSWTLSDMDKFYDFFLQEQRSPAPTFIIRNIHATGKVGEHYVEVDVQIDLSTSTHQPVRVPLGFKEGILPSPGQSNMPSFRYTGPGSAEITVEEGQYVAIVMPQSQTVDESRPNINQRHNLSLLLWVPYAPHNGGGHRLAISFPQSNTSRFLLEIPLQNVDASVSRGLLIGNQDNAERLSTLLTVQGLRTDTEIIWGKRKAEIVDDRPVLNVARASLNVRLDARSTIYEAELPVSSETGSFDILRIRLPQDSVLDRDISDQYAAVNEYTIEDVDETSTVTIRLQQATTGPVFLRLRALQHFEADRPDFARILEGFEVVGAERQSGILAVSVSPTEMNTHWEPIRGIRRSETVNPATTTATAQPVVPSASTTAGENRFDFISQPFSLRVRATLPRTLINVRPEYRFRISKGAIAMDARLSYTVSGSRAQTLYIHLGDSRWSYDFSMSNHVDTSQIELDASGLMMIPLRNPMEGTFDIDFQARRSIPVEDEQVHRIALPIPQPQVSWSESAPIIIIPDNNVELLPIDESYSASSDQRTHGLSRQTRRTTMSLIRVDLTELQQEPLYYRAELPDAQFVADVIFRQQRVNATMQTEVRLLEEHNQVTQHIQYHADFAMLDRLYFLIPRTLEVSGGIQVSLGNQPLVLRDALTRPWDNVSENRIPDNWVQKMILLPEPRFQFQLTFQYVPPTLSVSHEATAPFALSLINPVDVPVSNHSIHFFTPPGYRLELQNESRMLWEQSKELRHSYTNVMQNTMEEVFRSLHSAMNTTLPNRIALFVSSAETNIARTTIVKRAWLQTWLTGTFRRDLATYILRSTDDSVDIQLPPYATSEHRVIVRIDQQQIQPDISPTGMLTIPIALEQHNMPIEISIDYRYPFETSSITVPIILPSFAPDISVQYQYWQVILSRNKHIVGYPAGWTLEYDWAWNGLFWWRIPSIRKTDIGLGINHTGTEPTIAESSQYVFSHIQPPSYATLYIVDRALIILCSSAIALIAGLMLIYVPQSRYAASLFTLLIAAVAVLSYQPSLMLLMLQAATFGVFLALGAGYVYRILHRQDRWVPPALPTVDNIPQSYSIPASPSQTVHEVIMDEESASKFVEITATDNSQS